MLENVILEVIFKPVKPDKPESSNPNPNFAKISKPDETRTQSLLKSRTQTRRILYPTRHYFIDLSADKNQNWILQQKQPTEYISAQFTKE